MLKPVPFANAVAVTSLGFGVVLWLLAQVAPNLFNLIYNAQFLGANVSSLYVAQNLSSVVVTWVVLGLSGWVMGYVIATLYNRFYKS